MSFPRSAFLGVLDSLVVLAYPCLSHLRKRQIGVWAVWKFAIELPERACLKSWFSNCAAAALPKLVRSLSVGYRSRQSPRCRAVLDRLISLLHPELKRWIIGDLTGSELNWRFSFAKVHYAPDTSLPRHPSRDLSAASDLEGNSRSCCCPGPWHRLRC